MRIRSLALQAPIFFSDGGFTEEDGGLAALSSAGDFVNGQPDFVAVTGNTVLPVNALWRPAARRRRERGSVAAATVGVDLGAPAVQVGLVAPPLGVTSSINLASPAAATVAATAGSANLGAAVNLAAPRMCGPLRPSC